MEDKLQTMYNARFSGEEVHRKRNKIWEALCANYFQNWIPPSIFEEGNSKTTIVDVAAGFCEFINNIKAGNKIAIDLIPDTTKYASGDVTVIIESAFNLVECLGTEAADVVFISNFLEHLDTKEQVSDIFAQAKLVLRTGGRLLILQPNIKYTGGKYWDFFDHKLPLTEDSIIECAGLHGYKTVKCVKRFLPYTTKSRFPQAKWIVALYCKMMPLSGCFFGEQSFIVFEK